MHVQPGKPAAAYPVLFIVKSKANSAAKPKRRPNVKPAVMPETKADPPMDPRSNDPPTADPKPDPPITESSFAQRSQSVEHENRPSPRAGSSTISISPIEGAWTSSDSPYLKGQYIPHTGHGAHIPHLAHQTRQRYVHNPNRHITLKN